jgi:hypothetical protein
MSKSTQVFIIYAREDRVRAEQIYDSLAAEGFSPWMDSRDIMGGQMWEQAIKNALRKSRFVLVLLSRNSISKRGAMQIEFREALSLFSRRSPSEVFLLPARLDDCAIPETLARFQVVDLSNKKGWFRLLDALKKGIGNQESTIELRETIREQEESQLSKSHIFVAMPFTPEMEDIYHYGIRRAVDSNGYVSERIDQQSFVGSILNEIKGRIKTASAVIADLTGANPNVYLELGFAWGAKIPVVLLTQSAKELCFDVKDQRCIEYQSIKVLEELLTHELAMLKSKGQI